MSALLWVESGRHSQSLTYSLWREQRSAKLGIGSGYVFPAISPSRSDAHRRRIMYEPRIVCDHQIVDGFRAIREIADFPAILGGKMRRAIERVQAAPDFLFLAELV